MAREMGEGFTCSGIGKGGIGGAGNGVGGRLSRRWNGEEALERLWVGGLKRKGKLDMTPVRGDEAMVSSLWVDGSDYGNGLGGAYAVVGGTLMRSYIPRDENDRQVLDWSG